MSLAEVARRLHLTKRIVNRDWKSIKQKLGWVDIPEQFLDQVAENIQFRLEPPVLIGCGSVECRKDWIEAYGDFYDIEPTTPSRMHVSQRRSLKKAA